MLAYDTKTTLAAAKDLHARAERPNLFIKIPGTKEGLPAIEEAIFAGVPINVTLLFSREHYLAAAEAYLRGIERRIAAGLRPDVASVASLFVSRWDVAVAGKVPDALTNHLGIAIGKRAYKAYCDLIASPRYQRVLNAGGRPQRLLLASTGTKDPKASDVLYMKALAAPFTVNTMPESTLKAFADHGEIGAPMPADGGDCEQVLGASRRPASTSMRSPRRLQDEGAQSFVKSWNELMEVIASKSACARRRPAEALGAKDHHERARDRRRRDPREDPRHRAEHEPRQVSLRPEAHAEADGRGREEARARTGSTTRCRSAIPGPVLHGKPVAEPHNLGPGLGRLRLRRRLRLPGEDDQRRRDAGARQLQGRPHAVPRLGHRARHRADRGWRSSSRWNSAHLPYKKATYEDYVGVRALEKLGKKKWRKHVADVVGA